MNTFAEQINWSSFTGDEKQKCKDAEGPNKSSRLIQTM